MLNISQNCSANTFAAITAHKEYKQDVSWPEMTWRGRRRKTEIFLSHLRLETAEKCSCSSRTNILLETMENSQSGGGGV